MKTVKTAKGTELPLLNLKGKAYLQIAHRIQWFVEENSHYQINTQFLVLDDTQTVAKAVITIFDDKQQIIKAVTATKRETKQQFSDHTEKAETGAIGRALAELGYGTQYALSDLEEGDRLADAPLVDAKGPTSIPVAKKLVAVEKTGSFSNAKVVNDEEF